MALGLALFILQQSGISSEEPVWCSAASGVVNRGVLISVFGCTDIRY